MVSKPTTLMTLIIGTTAQFQLITCSVLEESEKTNVRKKSKYFVLTREMVDAMNFQSKYVPVEIVAQRFCQN